jgi:hypothetical protein
MNVLLGLKRDEIDSGELTTKHDPGESGGDVAAC